MRQFRPLRPDEIECRVATVKDSGISLLLYKTARTDYALFDETYGAMNWQCRYELINGSMYCGIGVYDNDKREWIWKYNCGTESNTETEKGLASDALKRAGFAWGCGTELYSAPFIWLGSDKFKKDGKYIKDTFSVYSISYDDSDNISGLVIKNQRGVTVYTMGEEPKAEKEESGKPKCENCGSELKPLKTGNALVSVPELMERSRKKYGKCLCVKCARAADDASHEG